MTFSCFLGELVDVFGKKAFSEVSAEAGADIEVERDAAFVSVANSKVGADNCAEAFSEIISEVITKYSNEVGIQAFVEAVSKDSSDVFAEDGFEIVIEAVFEANSEDNAEVVAEAFPVVVIAPDRRWIEIGRPDDLRQRLYRTNAVVGKRSFREKVSATSTIAKRQKVSFILICMY